MEGPSSCQTSDLTRATRRNIQEDVILHSHRRENLKSYIHRKVTADDATAITYAWCLTVGA
jgi:hypothetical protein